MKINTKLAEKIATLVIKGIDEEIEEIQSLIVEELMNLKKFNWWKLIYVNRFSTKEEAIEYIKTADIFNNSDRLQYDSIELKYKDQRKRMKDVINVCKLIKTKQIDLPYNILSELGKYKHWVK